MPTQGERLAVLENENTHTKEHLKIIEDKIDKLDQYVRNGMSKEISRQMKNGAAEDKTKFGLKPEVRDKIVLWAMRIAVFSIAGKEGVQFLLK